MLYPQNGDRFVIIDSVTSLHLLYTMYPYSACSVARFVICVCLAESVGIPFVANSCGSTEPSYIGANSRIRSNDQFAAAMRSFVKLL